MQIQAHSRFPVPDKTYVGVIRREITKLAQAAGLEENIRGRMDIVLSEMASNLVKHGAVAGELLVLFFQQAGIAGVELISLDNGPGMHDTGYMMTDGVSTYGSKGEGLGAIKRLSDDFDIYSSVATGTGILSRIYTTKPPARQRSELEVRAVCVPKNGENVSGDAWGMKMKDNTCCILAMDGLGHGKDAHAAATLAVQHFLESETVQPAVLLGLIHTEIKRTRGGVGAISLIDLGSSKIKFCGIGNITGKLWSREVSKSLISYNGTIGYTVPSHYNDNQHDWKYDSVLVMHSDGLKARWEMSKYPGLESRDSTLIAAILYKDNTRLTDDNLVVVAKTRKRE